MKVYAGYTTRTKVCSGFLNRNGYSAHIKEADISIRELAPELDEVAIEDGYKAVVRIPANYIGSAVGIEGLRSILCKSLGQAEAIMKARPHRNRAFLAAEKDGWRLTAEEAAKDAVFELNERAGSRAERQALTRESAATKLIEAGIFNTGWEISERVWHQSQTKIRIQNALAGDTSAAGCLRRDAVKN